MVRIVDREAAIKIEMQQPKCLESFECLSCTCTHTSLMFTSKIYKNLRLVSKSLENT